MALFRVIAETLAYKYKVSRNRDVLVVRMFKLLVLITLAAAAPRTHVFDRLPWPAARQTEDPKTSLINTPNIGRREIAYCVGTDALLWPRARVTGSDVIHYLTQRLRMYINVNFVRTGVGPGCQLTYNFVPLDGIKTYVGLYDPAENTITVSTTGVTVFESFKVTLHETLHSLGLGHNDKTPSIMTTHLTDVSQLIFQSDLNGLYAFWEMTQSNFGGKPLEEFDFYESIALKDVTTTVFP